MLSLVVLRLKLTHPWPGLASGWRHLASSARKSTCPWSYASYAGYRKCCKLLRPHSLRLYGRLREVFGTHGIHGFTGALRALGASKEQG